MLPPNAIVFTFSTSLEESLCVTTVSDKVVTLAQLSMKN